MTFFTAIDRYIFRLVLVPMLGVFALAASLLMLEKMLRLMEFVSTEGGPVTIVFKMLVNLIPEYAGLAIPLGLMLGILFAFRKLATTSELDVMRAVGLSYTRLLRVPYLITFALMGVNLAIVGYLQPLARYCYEQLDFELRSGALGASIKVGEFTTLEDRVALRIEQSRDEGRRLIGHLRAHRQRQGPGAVDLGARRALPRQPREPQHDHPPPDRRHDRPGHARRRPRACSTSRSTTCRSTCPRSSASASAATRAANTCCPNCSSSAGTTRSRRPSRRSEPGGFNYRMVEVVMMLLLPLLAVALAIPPKRSTSALGVFVSIVMVVAYHKVNQYGQAVAELGRVDPLLALWGPFALFAALIVWMYFRVAFVPGGQAIGALECVLRQAGQARRPRCCAGAAARASRDRGYRGGGRRCCLTSSPRAR